MPRLIVKSPYLKPNRTSHIANHIKYIATRDGVELAPDTREFLPATTKQKSLVNSILKHEPEAEELHEYTDYIHHPTRKNATEFISRACEIFAVDSAEREKYLSYIAERPGVENLGTNGLFTDNFIPINMAEIQREIAESNSNVWTHIISLKREDAERLGYNTADAWIQLLRSHRNDIARQMHISPKNFRWYAAFHNEGNHPHVHMMAYSVNPHEAFLTPEGINNIRSTLAKDIFADERLHIYQRQTEQRDNIKKNALAQVRDIVKAINQNDSMPPEAEPKLKKLAEILAKTKGKKVYGYMNGPTKGLIDSIVDDLEKDERIAELYNLWYESREDILRQYTDTFPKRLPLSKNKEFKSIKNMVIHEAMNIIFEGETVADIDKYERIRKRSKEGNADAQFRLSRILNNPDSKQYDPKEAIIWLKSAADNDNSNAQYLLGKLHLFGSGVEKDYGTARQYLEKSSEQGNPYAEQLLYSIDHDRNTFIALGAMNVIRYVGSIIDNKATDNVEKVQRITDRKAKQREREKKEAQGMHPTM